MQQNMNFQRFAELTKGKSAVWSFFYARLADRILVLENGTLLESGTHQDLLKPMVDMPNFLI
jgi:ATP-binding cassette subfamily B protein